MTEDFSVNEREEPAPCPWCGDEPLVTDESVRLPARGGWGVLCIDGGCNTNPHTFAPTRAEAVEQWNTRSKSRSPAEVPPNWRTNEEVQKVREQMDGYAYEHSFMRSHTLRVAYLRGIDDLCNAVWRSAQQ